MIAQGSVPVLDHGFVRLDDAMADDLSVVNGARVSFARHKAEVDDSDAGLIRFLMRERPAWAKQRATSRIASRSKVPTSAMPVSLR